jgi:hypothetical protein
MREDGAELRLVRRACSRLHLDQNRPHSLVLSVKKKELTEAEAMRRFTEYKSGGTPSHP